MTEITRTSKVPFGRRPDRGRRLCDCSSAFLHWIVGHLTDTDLHIWAVLAKEELTARKPLEREAEAELSLEEQADAILRNAGCGKLCKK